MGQKGCGKTRVLISRVVYLLDNGVEGSKFLFLTSTTEQATIVADAIKHMALDKKQSRFITVTTFPKLCLRIIKENQKLNTFKNGSKRMTPLKYHELVKHILKEWMELKERRSEGINKKQQMVSKLRRMLQNKSSDQESASNIQKISKMKMKEMVNFIRWAKSHRFASNKFVDEYEHILLTYTNKLRETFLIDWNDIYLSVVQMFQMYQQVLSHYRNQFGIILVDDYQDLNSLQVSIITFLSQNSGMITVAGNLNESIRSKYGSDFTHFQNFQTDFLNCTSIKLDQNNLNSFFSPRSTRLLFYSSQCLLNPELSNSQPELILNNNNNNNNIMNEKICYMNPENGRHEAIEIVKNIQNLVKGYNYNKRNYSEFAVLFRIRKISLYVELELAKAKIFFKWTSGSGLPFFGRPEIKHIFAYLSLITNTANDWQVLNIINVPNRYISKQTIDNIKAISEKEKISCIQVINKLTDWYERKMETVQQINEQNKKSIELIELKNQKKRKKDQDLIDNETERKLLDNFFGNNNNNNNNNEKKKSNINIKTFLNSNNSQSNQNISKIQQYCKQVGAHQLLAISKFWSTIKKLKKFSVQLRKPYEVIKNIIEEIKYFEKTPIIANDHNHQKKKSYSSTKVNSSTILKQNKRFFFSRTSWDENVTTEIEEDWVDSYSKKDALIALMEEAKLLQEQYIKSINKNPDPLFLLKIFNQFIHQGIRYSNVFYRFQQNPSNNYVTLSTIHRSKGLEFPIVYLVSFNEGIMPLSMQAYHKKNKSNPRKRRRNKANSGDQYNGIDAKEELRIAYVAFTRAKSKLILSIIKYEKTGELLYPSRYLNNLPQQFLERLHIEKPPKNISSLQYFQQLEFVDPILQDQNNEIRDDKAKTEINKKSSLSNFVNDFDYDFDNYKQDQRNLDEKIIQNKNKNQLLMHSKLPLSNNQQKQPVIYLDQNNQNRFQIPNKAQQNISNKARPTTISNSQLTKYPTINHLPNNNQITNQYKHPQQQFNLTSTKNTQSMQQFHHFSKKGNNIGINQNLSPKRKLIYHPFSQMQNFSSSILRKKEN
ncbi:DNA helicase ii [Anaeramoeba flamelloides]|uniref:DNA 3'-5' helicase n=1 Tax=Anaeramoeba flamelloides TaxID=1746091 RepID=A0ABQ8Y6T4_9EUKA|nr:DNA helicase ii [Anaeramoeba flamelloides]